MREEKIIGGLNTNAVNTARLYQSIVHIDARRQAFEKVCGKRWALLRAIVSPSSFWNLIDIETVKMLASHEKQMREAAPRLPAWREWWLPIPD